MRDEDIDYSDSPPWTDEDFARSVVRWGLDGRGPPPKSLITLRLDADVLEWFRSLGKGYQTRINLLLRSYMNANLEEAPAAKPKAGARRKRT
jgi:uncharacterized protein (DUF4415 family)